MYRKKVEEKEKETPRRYPHLTAMIEYVRFYHSAHIHYFIYPLIYTRTEYIHSILYRIIHFKNSYLASWLV